jgi:hypothetical protein
LSLAASFLAFLSALDFFGTRATNGGSDVEGDVDDHETKVAPAVAVRHVERAQEDVGVGDLTEVAAVGRLRVEQVAAGGADVGLHVGLAGLAVRRLKLQELLSRADDRRPSDGRYKQALGEIGLDEEEVRIESDGRLTGRGRCR